MKIHFRHAYKITALTAVSFGAVALVPGAVSAADYNCDDEDHKTTFGYHSSSDYGNSYKDNYEYTGHDKHYMKSTDKDHSNEYDRDDGYTSEDDYEYDHQDYTDDKTGYHTSDDSEHMYKSSDNKHHGHSGEYGSGGGDMNEHSNDDKYSEEQVEYRVELRSDMQEHVAVVGPALKAELLQSPDRDAAMDAVDMNTEAIAQKVDEVYSGSKAEFTELWGEHVGYYVDYTQAVRDGEEEKKESSKQGLEEFATEASNWFAEKNESYDQEHLHDMIAMHGNQTLAIIDAMAQEDYDTAYATAHEAYMHMGMLADYLTGYHSEEQ